MPTVPRDPALQATILDQLPDLVLRYDAADRILYANRAVEAATGRPRASLVGRSTFEVGVDPEVSARFAAARRRVFASGEPVTFDVVRPTAAGDRHIEYRIVPERSADGAIATVVAIGRDVTELVKAEGARDESERRLATLLSHVPGAMYRVADDPTGATPPEFVSDGVLDVVGYPADAFVRGRVRYPALVHPEDAPARDAASAAALEAGRAFELTYRVAHADGRTRWVWEQGRAVPCDGDGARMVEGLIVDVTDREEARLALEEERARLSEAQRIARLGSWSWDAVAGRVEVSAEWARTFGAPPDGVRDLGALFLELVDPEERARHAERAAMIRAERPRTTGARWRVVRPDGARRVVQMRSEWQYDDAGALVGGRGTFQDVTDDVEREARLTRQQAMLEESQRLAGVGSWELDLRTDAVTWSDEMYRIVGRSPDDGPMTRARVAAMLHPDDAAAVQATIAGAIATAAPTEQEYRMVTPDGSARTILARTRTDVDAAGVAVRLVGTCQDVTDRRRLEEHVRQAQKTEALGLLAGSVAHDFNNLLSAIIGGAELARLEVPERSQAARDLDDVREAGARAARLTRQLLAFSRKQPLRPRALDLRDAVRDAERLLRRLLPHEVALDIVPSPEPCIARADPGQLEQVLMNLVVNARDAIAGRGVVTVETACVALRPGDPRLALARGAPLSAGSYSALVVRDTGSGVEPRALGRLFEPFFTTKPDGRGTGLGLATVLGVVAQSGGGVVVESAPGAGTAFTVLLPSVDAPAESPELGAADLPGGTETILLVEDEGVVRETATRILERHGYRVIAARHGADALLAWRERGGAIDGVVCDLRMPEVGGRALVARLRAERPTLPVVVMSGYAEGGDDEEAELLAREPFLVKPFTTESLLVQVRAALDRR